MSDPDENRSNLEPEDYADLTTFIEKGEQGVSNKPEVEKTDDSSPELLAEIRKLSADVEVLKTGSKRFSGAVQKVLQDLMDRVSALEDRPEITAESAMPADTAAALAAIMKEFEGLKKADREAEKRMEQLQKELVEKLLVKLGPASAADAHPLPVVVAAAEDTSETPEKQADSEPQADAAAGKDELTPEQKAALQEIQDIASGALDQPKSAEKPADSQEKEPAESADKQSADEAESPENIYIGRYEFSPKLIAACLLIIGIIGSVFIFLVS